jgi:hypothetical protein
MGHLSDRWLKSVPCQSPIETAAEFGKVCSKTFQTILIARRLSENNFPEAGSE